MTFARNISIIAAAAIAATVSSAYAASDDSHDAHHPAATAGQLVAQASQPGQGTGGSTAMPDYASQMKAMQAMHERMLTANTPEERNALMAEQMKLMQDAMATMGRMGPGAMMGGAQGATRGQAGDMAARQDMMEQRMDMMHSMMQMMMDRMTPAPTGK